MSAPLGVDTILDLQVISFFGPDDNEVERRIDYSLDMRRISFVRAADDDGSTSSVYVDGYGLLWVDIPFVLMRDLWKAAVAPAFASSATSSD